MLLLVVSESVEYTKNSVGLSLLPLPVELECILSAELFCLPVELFVAVCLLCVVALLAAACRADSLVARRTARA